MGQTNTTALIQEKCGDYNQTESVAYYQSATLSPDDYSYYETITSDGGISVSTNDDAQGILLVLKAFFTVLCIFGLAANLAVLATVCFHGLRNTRPSNIFLFQLSAADVVLLISMVTQQFYESPKNFPFQQSLCKAIYGTDCFAQSMSSLILAGISWDRGLLLFSPRRRTARTAWIISGVAFIISICASIPFWINHNIVTNCHHKTQTCGLHIIVTDDTTGEKQIITETLQGRRISYRMVITSFVCSYVITVLHLLIFGGLIIGKVYCVSRRNDTLYGYSRANHYQRVVTIRIISLITTFVLCWSPFWILTLLNEMDSWNGHLSIQPELYHPLFACAQYLGYVNSSINPMIYAAMNDDFRASFRNFLVRLKDIFRPDNIPIMIRSMLIPSTEMTVVQTGDEPQTQTVQLLTAQSQSETPQQDTKHY